MSTFLPAHGGQLRRLSERYNIPASELLDFSANINPEGPPSAVLETLRSSLLKLAVLTDYPDLDQVDLKQSLARYTGLTPNHVAVSNGFVPLLEAALRTLPIRRCLLPVPAFNEYRKALSRANVEAIPHQLTAETSFAYDIPALLTGDHHAILLANPQNPSGTITPLDTILHLVAEAAARKIYVLLDEAFIDYAPGESACIYTDRFPNLIVFRSVTKFHGIPGLRIAYAIANPGTTASLNKNLAPWPITTLASLAAAAALEDDTYALRTLDLNLQRRTSLAAALSKLDIHIYPSAANFLLLRLSPKIDSHTLWERLLIEHHIVLRSCHDYEALTPGHLRAAVRTEPDNARLIEALTRLLSGM